jgi:glycosyltransferase involved in cell wall biosynthesis
MLMAAADHLDVTLVLVRRTGDEAARVTAGAYRIREVHAPPVPRYTQAIGSRTRRRLRLLTYSLPQSCYPRRLPRLREALADDEPDLVAFFLPPVAHLVHHAPAGTPIICLLEEAWERAMLTYLAGPDWKVSWYGRLDAWRFSGVYRRVNRAASAVVAIADYERDAFARHIRRDKIAVIPHGIDTSYFAPLPTRPDVDVLVVGDLRAPRNYVGALRTWEAARSRAEHSGWKWLIVGLIDPEVAAMLEQGGATVTGPVEDVRPYYARARAVLVPAFAGTGVKTTSLQAWAMGRPLVASEVGARGLPGRSGSNILVGEDPGALVDHLSAVLGDPVLADRLGAEGRSTAERFCDLRVIARQFADLCVDTVGTR